MTGLTYFFLPSFTEKGKNNLPIYSSQLHQTKREKGEEGKREKQRYVCTRWIPSLFASTSSSNGIQAIIPSLSTWRQHRPLPKWNENSQRAATDDRSSPDIDTVSRPKIDLGKAADRDPPDPWRKSVSRGTPPPVSHPTRPHSGSSSVLLRKNVDTNPRNRDFLARPKLFLSPCQGLFACFWSGIYQSRERERFFFWRVLRNFEQILAPFQYNWRIFLRNIFESKLIESV